jgi:heat shock protein HslJ
MRVARRRPPLGSVAATAFAAVLVTGSALVGCGDLPVEPGVSPDGRTFVTVSAVGIDLPDGARPRLTFLDGQVQLGGGCNSGGGGYRLDGDVLVVTSVAMTEMACAEPLMALDADLVALLTGRPTLTLQGDDLVLATADRTLTLKDRRIVEPDRPLEGTTWSVTTLITGDAASSLPAGTEGTVTLRIEDGRAQVRPGCNTGSATVQVRGGVVGGVSSGTIEFGPMALTRMACAPEVMQVETTVVSVLQGSVAYTIEAGQLTLTATAADTGAAIGLVLSAVS